MRPPRSPRVQYSHSRMLPLLCLFMNHFFSTIYAHLLDLSGLHSMKGKPLSFSIFLCFLCGDALSHLVKSRLAEAAIEKYAAFFTPLTKEGLIQADNLVEILKDISSRIFNYSLG